MQEIQEITGTNIRALQQRNPLSQFSVNERMSWTEKRETKREEDAAYCLLGILNIHMPFIYGEGRQKALNRLRKEIHGDKPLDRIFKWLAPPDFATAYHGSLKDREDNTGLWILDYSLFREWHNGKDLTSAEGRLPWIHGHPGAAKLQWPPQWFTICQTSGRYDIRPRNLLLFLPSRQPSHAVPVSAYHSILSQLLHRYRNEEAMVNYFHSIIPEGCGSTGQLASSEPELIKLLKICLNRLDAPCIILDGVDECSNVKPLLEIIKLLMKLPAVRILIFSRSNVHGLVQVIPEKDRLNFS